METEQVKKLLEQVESTATGLSGVAWVAKNDAMNQRYLSEAVDGMVIQLENLQVAIDGLKSEIAA